MRSKITLLMLVCLALACTAASAEVRLYRQFKDVSLKENGKVVQTADPKNLFECTYDLDLKNNTITRIYIRRLDEPVGRKDNDVYTIKEKRRILPSEAGNGGNRYIAIENGGHEILELGHRYAFTTRTSPFSQIISGVYKRVYDKEQAKKWHNDHDKDKVHDKD